jgi:phage terminase small subunit
MAVKQHGATKALALRPKTFLDHYTNPNQLDKEGKPTFGNATRAAAMAYNRDPDNTAHVQGARLLRNATIKTELEKICESLGWDVKVRLRQLADIAGARTTKTVRTKTYRHTVKDGKSKRHLETTQEIEVPTKDSDRLRAIVIANKVTGVDAVGSAMRAIATEESKRLYNRIVRPKGNK